MYETLDESRFNVTLLCMAREKAPGESFRQFFARKSISGVLLRTTAMPSRGFCRQIADEGLARFCDVFCDRGAFDVGQARSVLQRAASVGLR